MSKYWEQSHVMKEFEKIAAENGLITTDLNPEDKDFVGNPSEKTPVEGKRRYEPTEEYNVTKDDDIIEKAHPKTVEVAKAMGDGAVVENIKQQQDVGVDIATKMPSGALYGVHAELIKNLVKTANKLEEQGKIKEAKRVDEVIRTLTRPFSKSHLIKEAWLGWALPLFVSVAPYAWSLVGRSKGPGGVKGPRMPVGTTGKVTSLLSGATVLLSAFGHKLTSRKESLHEDTKDLYNVLLKGAEKAPACQKAADLLKPFLTSLNVSMEDDRGFKKFINTFNDLKALEPKLKSLIARAAIKLGEGFWFFGLRKRIEEKFETFKSQIEDTEKLIKDAKKAGNKIDNTLKQRMSGTPKHNEIKALQEIIFIHDKEKITGEMDATTIEYAKMLENNIDEMLKELGEKGSVKGKIIQDGKLNAKVSDIKKLLNLIEEALKKKK